MLSLNALRASGAASAKIVSTKPSSCLRWPSPTGRSAISHNRYRWAARPKRRAMKLAAFRTCRHVGARSPSWPQIRAQPDAWLRVAGTGSDGQRRIRDGRAALGPPRRQPTSRTVSGCSTAFASTTTGRSTFGTALGAIEWSPAATRRGRATSLTHLDCTCRPKCLGRSQLSWASANDRSIDPTARATPTERRNSSAALSECSRARG